MMTTKQIIDGGEVRITRTDGTSVILWIVDARDGRVFFAKTSPAKGQLRWWLPFDYVRQHGELVQ